MRHGTCFHRRLSAHQAGAAPHSAVAELGVVRRLRTHTVNRTVLFFALSVALTCESLASGRLLIFIYQPLTTLGTEQDAEVVVARIPLLTNLVPESIITHIGSANRLLQDSTANITDSNLLSLLGIRLSAEVVSGRHYRITLDIGAMLPTDRFGVTVDNVISGTIKCLQATFDENSENLGSYELHIQAKKDDKTDRSRYEGRYESKKKP